MPTLEKNKLIKLQEAKVLKENSTRQKMTNKSKFLYKNLEKPDEIALYYGFTPIETPRVTRQDLLVTKYLKEIEVDASNSDTGKDIACALSIEEKVAILRTYMQQDMPSLPQPVLLYCKGPIRSSSKKKNGKEKEFSLEILGTPKSVAEAILIKTAWTILTDEGFENLSLEINSIGDKDSIAKFTRELQTYYKKHIHLLPAHCKQTFKKDPFALLYCMEEKNLVLKENAPKSMSFLSESSRQHFKEVLEYIEILNIPYKINNSLLGKRCCTQTVFEIKETTQNKTIAVGVRYDAITKKIGMKREIPAVGIKIAFQTLEEKTKKAKKIVVKKSKFYFIQLGFDAKLKSLQVVEILRQAKIPLYQSLGNDTFATQIATAENMKIPYCIIMGQKEALEDSVIVRNMNTRSQDTVKITDLTEYLEKI